MATAYADQFGWVPKSPNLAATLERAFVYAEEQGHREVSLEHLLLALTEDPEAISLLTITRIDLDRLRDEVAGFVSRIGDRVPLDEDFTPRPSAELVRILDYGVAAAQQSRRQRIDGAIVLAALIGEGRSPAAELLKVHGLTFEETIRVLPALAAGEEPTTAAAAAAAPPRQTVRESDGEEILASLRRKISEPPPRSPEPMAAPSRPQAGSGPAIQDPARETAGRAYERSPAPPPRGHAPGPPPPGQPPSGRPASANGHDRPAAYQDHPSGRPAGPAHADPHAMPPPSAHRPPRSGPPAGYPPDQVPPSRRAGPPGTAPNGQRPPRPQAAPAPEPVPGAPPAPGRAPYPPGDGPATGRGRAAPAPAQVPPPAQARPGPPRGREPPPAGQRRQPARDPAMHGVDSGILIENIPRQMRVAVPEAVEVRIARNAFDALQDGLQGRGMPVAHSVPVTRAMSVRLRAPEGGFKIDVVSPETQWIENTLGLLQDDYALWRFTVTPERRGRARLQLIISARTIGTDGLTAETGLPDHVITVAVRTNLGRTLKRAGVWLSLALGGGVVGAVGEALFRILR